MNIICILQVPIGCPCAQERYAGPAQKWARIQEHGFTCVASDLDNSFTSPDKAWGSIVVMNGQKAPVIKDRHITQEDIYATFRGQVCRLRRVPGSTMNASETAASMTILIERTVSRTPIREAFLQLEKEGLVSMMSQYGTAVTKIDREEAKEERQLRHLLGLKNINSIAKRATEDDYKQLQELIEQQEKMTEQYLNLQHFALDDKFHHDQLLIGSRPLFLEVLKTRNSHYGRMRTMTTWNVNNVENSIRQHVELVNVLEKKKTEETK